MAGNLNSGNYGPRSALVSVVMSDETEHDLRKLVTALHAVVQPLTNGAVPPKWSDCGPEEIKRVLVSAFVALEVKERAQRQEASAAVQGPLETLIKAQRLKGMVRRAAAVELRAKQEALMPSKEKLAEYVAMGMKFPAPIEIPDYLLLSFEDLKSAFPEGTTETDASKILKDLGHTLTSGGAKSVFRLKVSITPADTVNAPTAAHGREEAAAQ